MRAEVGDQLQVQGPTVGQPARVGTIVDVRGEDGDPPYVVQFEDGHENLIYPGPDAIIHPRRPLDDEM
ncbi:DUF1918 domain-containing protein [Lipingzhangella sp. LS1_29]|uniref:DUF1918 domain-containing protein n=1 Tax=Lipingzhangella rawalii TaxID=2055835 RepID=A0ABU2H0N1_9ACTN|nr:DUF1918 domain-containing protein [Lipingzhangella rawalii]MDS1268857.1 DUF1918 domain-containing protein [Lipingzhangella rawalii]